MSQATEPLTEENAIAEALQSLSPGDELTVADESGYKDNRTVFDVDDTYVTFADPVTEKSQCRLLHKERATTHRIPERAEDGVSASGYAITKLWVWE